MDKGKGAGYGEERELSQSVLFRQDPESCFICSVSYCSVFHAEHFTLSNYFTSMEAILPFSLLVRSA